MAQPAYDMHTLMYELKQSSAQGTVEAQDLTRLTSLVLDRLGCATGSEAFDMLYADWRELPRGTLMSGMRAGQILILLIGGPPPGPPLIQIAAMVGGPASVTAVAWWEIKRLRVHHGVALRA